MNYSASLSSVLNFYASFSAIISLSCVKISSDVFSCTCFFTFLSDLHFLHGAA